MPDASATPPPVLRLHRFAAGWDRAADLRWANTAALLLFGAGVACGVTSILLEAHDRHEIERRHGILLASERLLSSVKDVETSYRGYALTGDDAYLVPLAAAEQRLPDQLRILDIDSAPKRRLSDLVDAKERFAQSVIDGRRTGRQQPFAELVIMRQIRAIVADIQFHAQRTIARIDARETFWTTTLGTVAAVSLPLAFLWVVAVGLLRRQRARIAVTTLRLSEERHRSLIQSSADIIWTATSDGRLRENQHSWTAFTGQQPAQYENDGWLDAVYPQDRTSARQAWQDAVSRNAMYRTEVRIRRADGEWRVMDARAVPILEQGTVREWVGTHTDVTEQRQAEENLRAAKDNAELANRAKSDFLANMSHELRTPLSAIIGYSELMGEEITGGCDPADLAADMAKVEANARHLLGLINNMLDLSKVEAGKMDVYAEDFAVEPMLRDLTSTVAALVTKRANTIELDLADHLGDAHTDLVKLRQILLNLLGNAAKFTENGTIHLSASRHVTPDGTARLDIAIQDSGIGMSPDEVAKLFQRFIQADVSTTRRFGGTGLGLSLSRALAEMLGGAINVESTPGQGSTFTVRIPAVYIAPARDHTPDQATSEDDPTRDLVLVIDDDPDQRALMTRILRRERFRVQTASDGISGLARARADRPRAILLDVLMPGFDGWSVLTELKADPELSTIPVVMVTSVDQRSLAASLGAADYVRKPVQWDRLGEVINRFRTQHGRILLVEDEFATRADLREALESDGWEVVEASDGQEALAKAAVLHPTIVLLDLNMPVMDGFHFLEQLRLAPGCAEVPVVILSGRDLSREDRQRLRGASQILNMGDLTLKSLTERLQKVIEHSAL